MVFYHLYDKNPLLCLPGHHRRSCVIWLLPTFQCSSPTSTMPSTKQFPGHSLSLLSSPDLSIQCLPRPPALQNPLWTHIQGPISVLPRHAVINSATVLTSLYQDHLVWYLHCTQCFNSPNLDLKTSPIQAHRTAVLRL